VTEVITAHHQSFARLDPGSRRNVVGLTGKAGTIDLAHYLCCDLIGLLF
jgi:hypothetical protein